MSHLSEVLHCLLPESRSRIPEALYLTADSVSASLVAAGLKLNFTPVPDIDSGDWDEESLMALVFRNRWDFHDGPMLIHPPACFRHGLPDFECDAGSLAAFIRHFSREMLFDGM